MSYKKLYLSNTSIKTYLTCKKKFKLKYVDKVQTEQNKSNKYMSFGNSMHLALADFNMITDTKYKTLEVLHNLLRKNWVRDGYESIEEEREFGKKGLDMLSTYYNNPKDIGNKNLIIEKMIYKECGDYILCGKLDKVYEHDDLVEIQDYKTGQKISQIDNIQLPLYLILANHQLNYYPSIVSLYYLAHNKKNITKVDTEFIEKSTNFIYSLCNTICSEVNFEASPNSYCNLNCEYYNICEEAKDESMMIINSLKQICDNGNISTVF